MITVAALACVGAIMLLLVWLAMFRRFQTSAIAMVSWILFFAFSGIGILLIAFRGVVPVPISIVAGNVCLFLGLGLCRFAISRTLAGKGHWITVLIAPAVWVGLTTFQPVYEHFSTRAAAANLLVAIVIGWITICCLRDNRKKLYIPYFIAAVGTVYGAAHVVYSALIYVADISTIQQALTLPVFAGFYFVGTLLFAIVLMLSFGLIIEVELQHFRHRAQNDDLTGLLNRRAFFERATRPDAANNVLVMIDIDHFKSVNDNYGHAVGDAVLAAFGKACRTVLPPDALASRLGGEEFAIFLPDIPSGQADALVNKLRGTFGIATSKMTNSGTPITMSAGVFSYRGDQIALEQALAGADKLLYAAKHDGRDQVRSSYTVTAGRNSLENGGADPVHV